MNHCRAPLLHVLAFGFCSLSCLGAPPSDMASATPIPAASPQAEVGQRDGKTRDLTHFNLGKDRLAIEGHDPVAYFPEGGGEAKRGNASFATLYEGVNYRFVSEKNKKLFLANPSRFEPLYGGWCAYAMARNEKVEVDPESFLITDGKLSLFFKAWYNDTLSKWQKDPKNLKVKADKAWQKLTAPPKPKPQ